MPTERSSDPEFTGRAEVVDRLYARLGRLRDGDGGVSLVVGDAGLGKSTLLSAVSRSAAAQGVPVLAAHAVSIDDPPPFSYVNTLLEGGLAPVADDSTDPDESGVRRALGLSGERGRIPRDWVLAQISERLLGVAGEAPLVVTLDDLHRADESSLAAVEFLAPRLAGQRLWILGSSRTFGSLSPAKSARLLQFEGATRAEMVTLRPLNPGELAGYVRRLQPARRFSAEELDRAHVESGGNPLLVQRVVRRLVEEDRAPPPPALDLPPLDSDAQRALDVAAVLGPEFSFELLRGATGEPEERLAEIVNQLVDRGLLFERAGELLEFPEDRLREEAYARMSERRRRLLHRRVGETREAQPGERSTRIFGLAHDFYLAKEREKSIEYNRQAAAMAEAAFAPDVARDFRARALESQRELAPSDLAGEASLVLDLARTNYELGRLEEADTMLGEFLERSRSTALLSVSLRATLQILRAQVLTARGDQSSSRELAEKILATPGLEGEKLVQVGAHHQLGLALYYEGRYPESLAHHTEELHLARELGDEVLAVHALKWHSALLGMMGQGERSLVEAREVADTLDRLGSPADRAQGHLFLGNMLADDRSSPQHRVEALTELRKAIRFGEEAHDPRRIGWARYWIAELLRDEGRWTEADENARRAHETLGQIGDRVGQAVAAKVRGQVALSQGAYDESDANLAEAEKLLRGSRHALEELDVSLRRAELLKARGDRSGALARLAELERLGLPRKRPDLAASLEALRRSLDIPAQGE